jgi:hypothetical protein
MGAQQEGDYGANEDAGAGALSQLPGKEPPGVTILQSLWRTALGGHGSD